MTSVSHTSPRRAPPDRPSAGEMATRDAHSPCARPLRRRLVSLPWRWSALCMVLGTSCFYVKKIPEPVVDQPPIIKEPSVDPMPKRVFTDTFSLLVVAKDPEGKDVHVEFPDLIDVPVEGPEKRQIGDLWAWSVKVLDTRVLPTTHLHALVTDGENVVEVHWDLELP